MHVNASTASRLWKAKVSISYPEPAIRLDFCSGFLRAARFCQLYVAVFGLFPAENYVELVEKLPTCLSSRTSKMNPTTAHLII